MVNVPTPAERPVASWPVYLFVNKITPYYPSFTVFRFGIGFGKESKGIREDRKEGIGKG